MILLILKGLLIILISSYHLLDGLYFEHEAKLCGRLTGAMLSTKFKLCINNDSYIFMNSKLLNEISSTRKDLYADLKTAIFEDISQPGVLIVVEKGSGNPTQVAYQMLSGIFHKMVDFMDSGKVWKYTYEVHKVHIKWILDEVKKLMSKKFYNKVVFTGHSLGGGTSILNAYACVKSSICNSTNTKVLTFGSPRTGDEVFAANYNKVLPETYRVIVNGDIVPTFPPCTKNFFSNECHKPIFDPNYDSWFHDIGYYHVGREIYYPNGYEGKYKTCRFRYEDTTCSPKTLPSIWTLLIKKEEFNDNHNRYFRIEKNGTPCRFI
uniref:Lipase_3 domain-containing protein n=1 Tax=Parastrongyloides trichosuri TaxID=131310 RepID=A0A0N4ZK32_PARTI